MVLEKTLESALDSKEIKPVNPKGINPDYSLESESEVAQLCPTLCNPTDCSTPGSCVLHYLPEFAQILVYGVLMMPSNPSHPLLPSSLFAFNLSQHQGLFQ